MLLIIDDCLKVEVVSEIEVGLGKGRIDLRRVSKVKLLSLIIDSCLEVEQPSVDLVSVVVDGLNEGLNFGIF